MVLCEDIVSRTAIKLRGVNVCSFAPFELVSRGTYMHALSVESRNNENVLVVVVSAVSRECTLGALKRASGNQIHLNFLNQSRLSPSLQAAAQVHQAQAETDEAPSRHQDGYHGTFTLDTEPRLVQSPALRHI